MKKTKVINLYGGPGTGKTTTSMNLCGLLKSNHINAELIKEYVKNFVWEGREILTSDQIYILGKQHRSERILYGKADVIVTDSPMWLTVIYERKLTEAPHVNKIVIDKLVRESRDIAEHYHVFLKRVHPYQTEGRYHDEIAAREIDQEIKDFLTEENIPFIEVDADWGAEDKIAARFNLLKK